MCGIAGIVDRREPTDKTTLLRMLATLRHRGPDGSGTFHDRDVSLGHCRLAVLDPSPAGRQPMVDASGRFVCTYNGAIYNFVELRRVLEKDGYRFRSTGDTEVLLAAYATWGAGCLDRLNGMFAFAVYDRWSRELFCARDRLGVKPFVYVSDGRRFAFASEHKALTTAGLSTRRVSPAGIYEFVAQGYVSSGGSLFEDIRSLPPGHALHIGADRQERIWQWWRPGCEPAERDGAAEAEVVRELLADATRLRLRSDVPVGTHLSGGLDSSAVVAAATLGGAGQLVTFTGAFAKPARADERKWSRLVADGAGMRRVEIELDVDALAEVFRRVVWHLDEPVVGPGVLPQQLVYDSTARDGIKVVLSGHGGDELFGGYLRHRGLHFRQLLRDDHDPRRRAAAAVELCRLAAGGGPRLTRPQSVRDTDLHPGFLASVDPAVRERARRRFSGFTSAAELMRWDLQHYLPGLLHAEDRISMASSVESRAPLLDHRLVDFATRLPDRCHFRRGTSKPVLRDAVEPWLPRPVAERRDKRGFPTPLGQWKRHTRMRRLVLDLVRPSGQRARDAATTVFAAEYLSRPEAMSTRQLWTVMLVQAWLESVDEGQRSP